MSGSFNRVSAAGLVLASLVLLPGTSRAEGGAKLPQLDATTFSSQIFWLVVYFVIIYLFMRFVGVPRVAAIIDARKAKMDTDLTAAETLRKQVADARAAYEATMAEAHTKARQLLAETHERNVVTLADQTRAAAAQYDARVAEAVERIQAASAEALKSIPDIAAGLAGEIAGKLSGRVPAAEAVARAVSLAAGREAA